MLGRSLSAEEGAVQVDVDDRFELCGCRRDGRDAADDTGEATEDVDRWHKGAGYSECVLH